jgi:hypothetical protein
MRQKMKPCTAHTRLVVTGERRFRIRGTHERDTVPVPADPTVQTGLSV